MFTSFVKPKFRWSTFASSLGLHSLAIVLMLGVPLCFHETLRQEKQYIATELLIPKIPSPVQTKPPVRLAPVLHVIPTTPLEPPELPRHSVLRAPELVRRAPSLKVPEIASPPVLPAAAPQPPIQEPAPVVKAAVRAEVFTSSSAALITEASLRQVQTGGFGDPNGVSGPTARRAPNIGRLGAFDLPAGSGEGNGIGGTRGLRGVVAATGFGSGVAEGGSAGSGRRIVQQSGFGEAIGVAHTERSKPRAAEPPATPVEIVYKPKPVYTDEARSMHLQGEVLLEVIFRASGELTIVRMLRGLGHGLDEAAIHAAQQIRYKPSQRDGKPIDATAIVHIIFQLAD